jgi:hypothetical protein
MIKYRFILRFSAWLIIVSSCNYGGEKMCGELTEKEREFINDMESSFENQIKLKPIPCEYKFISVYIKETANDTILYQLHDSIRTDRRSPWNSLDVYDWDKNQLFQQYYVDRKGSYSRKYFN